MAERPRMTAAQLPAEGRAAQRAEGHVRPLVRAARQQCNQVMDYLRRHGPFEPHRLPLDEMEYTTMPSVAERLAALGGGRGVCADRRAGSGRPRGGRGE
jgi:hypothetical protein